MRAPGSRKNTQLAFHKLHQKGQGFVTASPGPEPRRRQDVVLGQPEWVRVPLPLSGALGCGPVGSAWPGLRATPPRLGAPSPGSRGPTPRLPGPPDVAHTPSSPALRPPSTRSCKSSLRTDLTTDSPETTGNGACFTFHRLRSGFKFKVNVPTTHRSGWAMSGEGATRQPALKPCGLDRALRNYVCGFFQNWICASLTRART